MIDDDEWEWLASRRDGRRRPPAARRHAAVPARARRFHHLEAWNEAVCGGAWGSWATGWGEKLRRALDLEHWAAFNYSFRRLERLLDRRRARASAAARPRRSSALGGDVHHAYLAEVGFRRGTGVAERRLSGGLLAVSQPARPRTSGRWSGSRDSRAGGARRAPARPRGGRARPGDPLAARPAADVRQPVRDARARRPLAPCCGSSARSATTPTTGASRPRSSGAWPRQAPRPLQSGKGPAVGGALPLGRTRGGVGPSLLDCMYCIADSRMRVSEGPATRTCRLKHARANYRRPLLFPHGRRASRSPSGCWSAEPRSGPRMTGRSAPSTGCWRRTARTSSTGS